MRLLLILIPLALAACTAAGNGGGQAPAAPAPPDDAVMGPPGLPSGNDTFSPTNAPTTDGGRYYGYD